MGKFKCATVSGYGLNFRPMLSARKSGSRTSRRSWARTPAILSYLPRRILPVRRSVQAGSPVASRGGCTILPPDFRRASCWMSFIIIPRPARGAGVRPKAGGEDVMEPRWHQVVDIPPLLVEVMEHQSHARCCPGCHVVTWGEIPGKITRHRFGPRLAALVGYLSGSPHVVSVKRTSPK